MYMFDATIMDTLYIYSYVNWIWKWLHFRSTEYYSLVYCASSCYSNCFLLIFHWCIFMFLIFMRGRLGKSG